MRRVALTTFPYKGLFEMMYDIADVAADPFEDDSSGPRFDPGDAEYLRTYARLMLKALGSRADDDPALQPLMEAFQKLVDLSEPHQLEAFRELLAALDGPEPAARLYATIFALMQQVVLMAEANTESAWQECLSDFEYQMYNLAQQWEELYQLLVKTTATFDLKCANVIVALQQELNPVATQSADGAARAREHLHMLRWNLFAVMAWHDASKVDA